MKHNLKRWSTYLMRFVQTGVTFWVTWYSKDQSWFSVKQPSRCGYTHPSPIPRDVKCPHHVCTTPGAYLHEKDIFQCPIRVLENRRRNRMLHPHYRFVSLEHKAVSDVGRYMCVVDFMMKGQRNRSYLGFSNLGNKTLQDTLQFYTRSFDVCTVWTLSGSCAPLVQVRKQMLNLQLLPLGWEKIAP